jgi:pSer/pThr/pTyr-binding forkhead associated (FHA) protein
MTRPFTLTARKGKFTGKTYELAEEKRYLIGRGDDCDLCLFGDTECCTVSRHHCEVWVEGGACRVRDLGSCNGTRLNGMQIGRPMNWYFPPIIRQTPCRDYTLHEGDVLQVGQTVLAVSRAAPANSKNGKRELVPVG